MESVSIPLDGFTISDKTGTLSLELSGSLSFAASPEYPWPASMEDVSSLIREGNLWIMRTGSCRIEIAPHFNGVPLDIREVPELWDWIALLVEEADVSLLNRVVASI